MNATRLLLEVSIDEGIQKLFYVETINELENMLKTMEVEDEGYLTWGEFVELLFKHRRAVKPSVNLVEEKLIKDAAPKIKSIKAADKPHENVVKDYRKKPKKEEDPKITVPKPFSFNERDKVKKKVVTAPVEESYQQFTANPIPVSTLLPKYEMIVAKNEARRMEIKQASYAMTKAKEKPFSFYERDKEKHLQRMNADDRSKIKEKQFKANPIPPHVTVQLYEQMTREREERREKRIKKNAEESLVKSKLPPRMETDYHKKKPPKPDEEFSFKPNAARPLPDFKKQYDEFQRVLEKHKQEKKPTTPMPFNFEEAKVRAKSNSYMDLENAQAANFRVKLGERKPPVSAAPAIVPPTTTKFTQAMELREKKEEEERKREEQLKKEEQRRQERIKELAPGVRSRIVDTREKQKIEAEEESKRKREATQRQEEEWTRKKREIAENVVRRTLLMDQAGPHRSSEVLRLEALARTYSAVKEINEENDT